MTWAPCAAAWRGVLLVRLDHRLLVTGPVGLYQRRRIVVIAAPHARRSHLHTYRDDDERRISVGRPMIGAASRRYTPLPHGANPDRRCVRRFERHCAAKVFRASSSRSGPSAPPSSVSGSRRPRRIQFGGVGEATAVLVAQLLPTIATASSSAPGRAAGDPAACWSAECTSRPHRWPRSVCCWPSTRPVAACRWRPRRGLAVRRHVLRSRRSSLCSFPGHAELSAANVAIGWLYGAACLLGPAITAVCIADDRSVRTVPRLRHRGRRRRHRRGRNPRDRLPTIGLRTPSIIAIRVGAHRGHTRKGIGVPSWSCSRRGRSSTVPSTCCTSLSRSMSSAGAPRTPAR